MRKIAGINPTKISKNFVVTIALIFALFIISPIVVVLFTLIIRPLLYKKLAQQKIYAEGVNLRG